MIYIIFFVAPQRFYHDFFFKTLLELTIIESSKKIRLLPYRKKRIIFPPDVAAHCHSNMYCANVPEYPLHTEYKVLLVNVFDLLSLFFFFFYQPLVWRTWLCLLTFMRINTGCAVYHDCVLELET